MDLSGAVDELSGAELLDTADALARGILEAEAQLLVVAAQFGVVNGPDTVDLEQANLPGRQTAKRYGGAGTPEVASFAPAELGARIGRSTYAGECSIDDGDGVRLLQRDTTGVARIEGIGVVTETWVRDLLGPRATITYRPVLDLAGHAPVDAWEIPDRHRRAVRLMTPADTFPFATATVNQTDGWSTMQIDHTVPHPEGPSAIGNYGPLTGQHHNLKTHGNWDVAQPFPGIYLWRDPNGAVYLVDHTGTRRLRYDDAA
jgi:hypothetical protein